MLIGIMRRSIKQNKSLPISEYEYFPLLKDDTLIKTKQKFSLEAILNELSIFKEDCDDNEQALVNSSKPKKNEKYIYLILVM